MSTPPVERPPIDVSAGAYGGRAAGGYSEKLRDGLYALANPTGKLTHVRIAAMRAHYQLAACLLVLSLPLIDADAVVECEDEDIAAQLTASWELKRLDVMRSAAKALSYGYSPNTLRWGNDANLDMLVVDRVYDLDPTTCQVITDAGGSFAGIRQKVTGADDLVIDNPLQCLWITEGMESGNLYGRPLLRAALDPWRDHLDIRIKQLLYLERFGEPVVKGRYPDGSRVANQQEINDALAWNADPANAANPKTVPAPIVEDNQAVALRLGESLAAHSVLALNSDQHIGPDGKPVGYAWDIDFLESSRNDGSVFADALDRTDRSMARALFIPDTLFANPDTGTYALGRQHRSIFDSSTEGRLSDYARQITAYTVERERLLNFGPGSPPARLTFSGVTDTDSDRLWGLAQTLVQGGTLPVDVARLGAELGIPLLSEEDQTAADAGSVAASPFSSVGLPALVTAGIISAQEAHDLLGLDGEAPVPADAPPPPPPGDVTDSQMAQARAVAALLVAGRILTADQRVAARTALGLSTARERVVVHSGHRHAARLLGAGDVGDTSTLPGYAQPQAAADDSRPFARTLTRVEARVPFAKLESGLNDAEATAIESLSTLLGQSREAVLRQVAGIMGKPTQAEQIAAISSVDLKLGSKVAGVWETLIRGVWQSGLDSVRTELADLAGDVAAKVPASLGPEARATASVQAATSANAQGAKLLGGLQASVLNAIRSGVSRAGVEAIVSATYDRETTSEGSTPRLATRTLSAQALNGGRVDAVTRGGIRLRGAQYSAILDRSTCELCERLDEQVIAIENTDLAKFTPPVHHNCRCVWVWITDDELDFTPTWTGAPQSLIDANGGLVIG